MFKHILAPHDGSALSDQTLDRAIALAQTTGARLTVFNATAEAPFPVTNFGEEGRYDPERAKRFSVEANAHGQTIVTAAVEADGRGGADAEAEGDVVALRRRRGGGLGGQRGGEQEPETQPGQQAEAAARHDGRLRGEQHAGRVAARSYCRCRRAAC